MIIEAKLLRDVDDVQGVKYKEGDIVEVIKNEGQSIVWVRYAHYLPLTSNEWKPVINFDDINEYINKELSQ